MSVHVDGLGAVVLDDDKGRTQTIPAGTADADLDAAMRAFFGPPRPAPRSSLAFRALFAPGERTAIFASTDPQVRDFMWMAAAAETIDLADPVVVQGVGYLVSLHLLTDPRGADILAGRPPPPVAKTADI